MTSTASRPAARGSQANGKSKYAQDVIHRLKESTGAGDTDIQFALQESNGDVNAAAAALLDGNMFVEVKKKPRSRPAEKPTAKPSTREFPRRDNDRRDVDRSGGPGRGRGRGDYDGNRTAGRGARGGRGRGGRGSRDAESAQAHTNAAKPAPGVVDYGAEGSLAVPVSSIPDQPEVQQQTVPAPAPARAVAPAASGFGGGSWASKLKEQPQSVPGPEPEPISEHHDTSAAADDAWGEQNVQHPVEHSQPEEHAPVEQHDTFGSGFNTHDTQSAASAWGAPPSNTNPPQWGSQQELPPTSLEDPVAKQYDAPPGMPVTTQPYSTTGSTQRAFDLSSLGPALKDQFGTDEKGYNALFPKESAAQEQPATYAQAPMPAQDVDFRRYGFQPNPEPLPSEPETKDVPPAAYMQPAPGFGHQYSNQPQGFGDSYSNAEERQPKQPEPTYNVHEPKPEVEQQDIKASAHQEQDEEQEQEADPSQQDGNSMNQYGHLPHDVNWNAHPMPHQDMFNMPGQRPAAAGQIPGQQGMMTGQPNMQMPGQSQAQMTGAFVANNPNPMTGYGGGYGPNMGNFPQMANFNGYMQPAMGNYQMPPYNAYGQYPTFQGTTPYNPAAAQAPFHGSPSNYSGKPQYSDNYSHSGANGAGRGRGRKGKAGGRGGGGGNYGQQMGGMPADTFNPGAHAGAPGQFAPAPMNYMDPQWQNNAPARYDNFKEKQGQQAYSAFSNMQYADQSFGAFSQQYQGYPQHGNWGNQDKAYGKGGY